MPVLEGKRMILFIAPKKTAPAAKPTDETPESETNEETRVKKAPQVKAKKEYLGPRVEGEDFWAYSHMAQPCRHSQIKQESRALRSVSHVAAVYINNKQTKENAKSKD